MLRASVLEVHRCKIAPQGFPNLYAYLGLVQQFRLNGNFRLGTFAWSLSPIAFLIVLFHNCSLPHEPEKPKHPFEPWKSTATTNLRFCTPPQFVCIWTGGWWAGWWWGTHYHLCRNGNLFFTKWHAIEVESLETGPISIVFGPASWGSSGIMGFAVSDGGGEVGNAFELKGMKQFVIFRMFPVAEI